MFFRQKKSMVNRLWSMAKDKITYRIKNTNQPKNTSSGNFFRTNLIFKKVKPKGGFVMKSFYSKLMGIVVFSFIATLICMQAAVAMAAPTGGMITGKVTRSDGVTPIGGLA